MLPEINEIAEEYWANSLTLISTKYKYVVYNEEYPDGGAIHENLISVYHFFVNFANLLMDLGKVDAPVRVANTINYAGMTVNCKKRAIDAVILNSRDLKYDTPVRIYNTASSKFYICKTRDEHLPLLQLYTMNHKYDKLIIQLFS